MPGLFVVLWSTGFIGAKLGLPHAEPMTFLFLRFVVVAAVLSLVVTLSEARWPARLADAGHLAVSGVLLHGIYLGGVFAGIDHGVEAGAAALITALQPVLVAVLAGAFLGEKVRPRQWIGLALGLAGVLLVVWRKLELGLGTPLGVGFVVAALVGMTIGTLYQKRWCTGFDLRTASAVQFIAAAIFVGTLSLIFEERVVEWTPAFAFALFWLVVVLSFGAISLLLVLIRQGAATRVSSLLFLVPPSTAAIAWVLFDEQMNGLALVGMIVAVSGVALVNLGGNRA